MTDAQRSLRGATPGPRPCTIFESMHVRMAGKVHGRQAGQVADRQKHAQVALKTSHNKKIAPYHRTRKEEEEEEEESGG